MGKDFSTTRVGAVHNISSIRGGLVEDGVPKRGSSNA